MAENEYPDIPEDMPEPFRSIIIHNKEVMAKAQMHGDAESHALYSWLTSLDKDALQAMNRMMLHISNAPSAADFYLGWVNALLTERHNYCVAHGVNHDEELAALVENDNNKN